VNVSQYQTSKLYYKVIVTKTAWFWHKNRQEDEWNRIEDPEIKPYNYSHMILTKEPKTSIGEKTASLMKGAWKTIYIQKTEADSFLILYKKRNKTKQKKPLNGPTVLMEDLKH
jgi:hypothetical protein